MAATTILRTVRWTLREARSLQATSSQPFMRGFHASSTVAKQQKTLAIYREEYNVWERRAPLAPAHVQTLTREGVKVLVQPSSRRAYSSREYEKEGAIITEDISEADVLIGVKRPPIHRLIPDKTYVFFSHTIKGQAENMKLLDAILDKGIRLVDYECILDNDGRRLVAFGKYAGVCGMINILHGLGVRLLALGHHTPFMYVGAAHNYPSTVSAKAAISALGREIQHGSIPKSVGPLVFVFTGAGNVSKGAQEVFQQLPHEFVPLDALKKVVEYGDTRKVYGTVVDKQHHLVRKDGRPYSDRDFAENSHEYKATFFEKAMPYASCLVNGVFWAPGTTRLITEEQGRTLHPANFDSSTLIHEGMPRLPQRLLAIADISNDLGGSLEFVRYNTTIDHPFIIQNLHTGEKSTEMSDNGILIMAVDNLPAQVPRESTDYFGSKMLPLMYDCLKIDGRRPVADYDVSATIKKAVITQNGDLTGRFQYIEGLRKNTSGVESSAQSSALKDML